MSLVKKTRPFQRGHRLVQVRVVEHDGSILPAELKAAEINLENHILLENVDIIFTQYDLYVTPYHHIIWDKYCYHLKLSKRAVDRPLHTQSPLYGLSPLQMGGTPKPPSCARGGCHLFEWGDPPTPPPAPVVDVASSNGGDPPNPPTPAPGVDVASLNGG